MECGWYYVDELSPSEELVDKFADSKFGMDKWTSFSREIIQNSLDARDDENAPVEVVFDLNKKLRINDIPDGNYIKYVLSRCAEKATNKQTKQAYQKGLEILGRPYVYCLKVSDFNTKGVETGRDKAWGAFVFDEGKSVKQRPGSAGSHGVGKKVPFIISTCNTVFYATKNKYKEGGIEHSDVLVQGKTSLTNWDDENGKTKSAKGWYGIKNPNDSLPRNRILPIKNYEVSFLHSYFVRNDKCGTDVIMVGVNAYNNEDAIKRTIISSILENFFVAIKEQSLKVVVFGQSINSGNLESVYRTYYTATESLRNSMNDLLRVYAQEPVVLPVKSKSMDLGSVELYFEANNELNRRYYTVVRDHGMKICEYRINSNRANKVFTAIAIIRGEKLNTLLSELENAAHDTFVLQDEDMDLNPDAVKAMKTVQNMVEHYIVEHTKIDDGEDQPIDDLYEILAIPGFSPQISKKDTKARIKKNKVMKKKKSIPRDPKPAPPNPPAPGTEPKGPKKPRKQKTEKVYDMFTFGPVLVKNSEGYLLRLKVKDDIKNAEFLIRSINSDEKVDNSIADLIVSASEGFKRYKIEEGWIKKVKLNKDQLHEIQIKTKREIRYRLTAELWYKEV